MFIICLSFLFFFFFFQAEDGIRDGHVTGVQTCALPIFRDEDVPSGGNPDRDNQPSFPRVLARSRRRSEEHTSELQSRGHLVCRLLLEKKKKKKQKNYCKIKKQHTTV